MSKKRVCSYVCIISIAALIVSAVIIVGLNSQPTVRELDVQNPDGTTGTVFVVFRPGVTGFNEEVVNEFVRGLVDSDWRVEVTTTSVETPTNVTGYDLIVLGTPVNGGQPHAAMMEYLAIADFLGKPIVLIVTSGGENADPTFEIFRNATINANGTIHSEFHAWLFESTAASRAYTAGTEITL